MTTQTKQKRHAAPVINMAPVDRSSTVSATGYDPATKTLAVQFKGGLKTYHYAGVPESVFGDMSKAESVGKFINTQVAGRYKHTYIPKAD